MRIVVTSIGTGEGKTFFARGLCRSFARSGVTVAALKPFETGVVEGCATDARALERAANAPLNAFEADAFFRAMAPLSPLAAVRGGALAPDLPAIERAFDTFEKAFDVTIIESAGGLFVPLVDRPEGAMLFVDLLRPDDRVFLVATSKLGVLSHVIACARAFRSTAVEETSFSGALEVVLRHDRDNDASSVSNAEILRATGLTVYELEASVDDDDALADAVAKSVPLRRRRSL